MSQTAAGAQKAIKVIKEKYGNDHYKRLGHLGGTAIHTRPRGFAANPELASRVGKIGGAVSRRRPKPKEYINAA